MNGLPEADALAERPSRGYWAQSLRRLRREPAALLALAVVASLFVVGGLAHELAPQGWNDINLATRWQNHAPTLARNH
ncbi:MAG: hypothetical protein ACYDCH_11525, partial [Gaiellaceae bacterium]